LSTYPAEIREQAVAIKRAHPHWGPANVKLELKRQEGLSQEPLPSNARLSALFKAVCPQAVQPRLRRHYPEQSPSTAKRPHQRWQIDGQESIRVGDRDVATILNIRDPTGALIIASRAFVTTTKKGYRKLTLEEVQDTLRQAFAQWGLPLEIQTDREQVYIGAPQCHFPSLFTLWLVGLGIQHIVSRSHRPTDQPHVERGHRTIGDMAWKDLHCTTLNQLQTALDECRQRYNHELPVQAAACAGRPPLAVHPWAEHSGRTFHREVEWTLCDIKRVDAYLAQQIWTRKVGARGVVHVGRHRYQVGCIHAGERVAVRFIPEKQTFQFQASDGTWTVEHAAIELDQADIIGRVPLRQAPSLVFQLPLPLEGV
jgi:hypothetical protein